MVRPATSPLRIGGRRSCCAPSSGSTIIRTWRRRRMPRRGGVTSRCDHRRGIWGLREGQMSGRNARLLEGVERNAPLIEIGPSFNPVAPKSAGWQVTIVDHASQADLVAKYAGAVD